DGNDITVTGPNAYSQNASTVSFTPASGNSITVTYSAAAPTGGWGGLNPNNKFNVGAYSVTVNANQVADTDGTVHFVGKGSTLSLGTFKTNFSMSLLVDKT